MQHIEVAVDFPDDRLRTFTYAVPQTMSAIPGDLVWVPFGSRLLQGVVFGVPGSEQHDGVEPKEISSVVEGGPFLDLPHLRLARWIASHYRTTLFVACTLMLPPGSRQRLRAWIRREQDNFPADITLGRELKTHEQRVLETLSDGEWHRKDRVARRLGRGGNNTVDRLIR